MRHANAGDDLAIAAVFHGDRELVATEPRQGVTGSQVLLEANTQHVQDVVADRVADRVVDRLEVVEVDHHDHDRPSPAAIECLLHTVAEEHPVRETGRRVVECLMAQVLFECFALGHVVRIDDDAVHGRIGGQVGHGEIEGAPLAATAGHAQLGTMRYRGIGGQTEQQGGQRETIVGMYEARQFVADDSCGSCPNTRVTDALM